MNQITQRCASCGTRNKIYPDKQHLRPRCGRCGAPLTVGPVELTDADFGSFINAGSLPVMVDFYSPTCGPCQMLNPVVTRLAAKFSGTLQVAKIDTGRNPLTANHYQIRGVPTLLFFSHGKVIEQLVGAMPEGELTQRIQQLIRT